MVITTGPHRGSAECIQALEQEMRRLEQLLAFLKQSGFKTARSEQT